MNDISIKQGRRVYPHYEAIMAMKRAIENCSIPDLFEQQVNRYADNNAVKTDRYTLSYNELNKAANRVAQAILARGGEGEEPIALLLEHEAHLIVALLGALKAGKIYVALDPTFPPDRSSYILKDTQAQLIVTNAQNFSLAEELIQDKTQLINIDELDPNLSDENPGLSISPDTPSAIFYTSGSTGQPKGVIKSHYNMTWLDGATPYLCSGDRQSLLYSCSFGVSSTNIFGALLTGATLCLYDVKKEGVAALANWLTQQKISRLHPPLGFFRQFLDVLTEEDRFPAVRQIALGSQSLYRSDVERLQLHFPNSIVIHTLASTETGAIAQFFIDQRTEILNNLVPVGYVVEDKEVLILDERGKNVGFNEIGEIAVKGRDLALGYWQRPDLTQTKFRDDPEGGDKRICLTGDLGRMRPDGCLEHFGRQDFQVKIRGYRIEIVEIEIALHDLDVVKEAVVVAQQGRAGDKRLVAYWVPAGEPAPTVSALRSSLAKTLPGYMIPSVFVKLKELPLTANGKVDRQALPEPDAVRPELDEAYVAPQTSDEEVLAKIWSEVLGIEQVGIHDNFFELGGQSLLAAQVVSQIRKVVEADLSLRAFFNAPTIAELAIEIERIKEHPTALQNDQDEKENLKKALRLLESF